MSVSMMRFRMVSVVFVILIMSLLITTRPPQTTAAQFVIAGWTAPDEYGQGFYIITPYQNSSGSFVTIPNPDTGIGNWYRENTTTAELNFTANTALRFDARVLVNHTLLGFAPAESEDGRNYFRLHLEMSVAGDSVFTLQNMTYDSLWGIFEVGIWWFSYVDIVDYILEPATIYTVTFSLIVYAVI